MVIGYKYAHLLLFLSSTQAEHGDNRLGSDNECYFRVGDHSFELLGRSCVSNSNARLITHNLP